MQILTYLGKHAAQLVILALLVSFAVFLLSSAIPGDFFSTRPLDSTVRAETIELLRHKHGLDQPVHIQFVRWLARMIKMDFGESLFYQRPVRTVVADAMGKTLWIGLPALVLGFIGGIILGSFHAAIGDHWASRLLDGLSAIALSLPSLLLGLASLLFAAHTGWFPLGGMTTSGMVDSNPWFSLWDRLRHLVLPVLCLTVPILASIERIQYAAARTNYGTSFLKFARSRGLSGLRFFWNYILRPGINPVLSVSGPMLGAVLSGSLVLEVIFAWPGLGQITYDALFNKDIFLLAGCVVGSSVLLISGNLLADLALIIFDPRTRSHIKGRIR